MTDRDILRSQSSASGEKVPVREAAARAVAGLHERDAEPDWTDPDDEDAAWYFALVDAVLAHLDGRTWEIAQTLHEDNDRLRAALQGVTQLAASGHACSGGILRTVNQALTPPRSDRRPEVE